MKKILLILTPLLAIAAAAGIYFMAQSDKFQYNAKTAIGNTAGNLYNGGSFCEYNDKIYFANPCDNNQLYVMDSDCTNASLLSTDKVSSINICGNYLYYSQNNYSGASEHSSFRNQLFGIHRMTLDGKGSIALDDSKCGIGVLSGNNIYYQHYDESSALTLYQTKIDNTEKKALLNKSFVPASVNNGLIYYADMYNKNMICTYNPSTGEDTVIYSVNAYMVDATDSYIYYIDLSKEYALVRINRASGTVEQLYKPKSGKVINYNRYGNKIFFQVEGEVDTGLYRMNSDGTAIEFIASGDISSIHCTSQYTFFRYYNVAGYLYRVPTTAPISSVEEIIVK